jgi:ATP-dependent Zn protease
VNTKISKRLQATAHHEAGHAVAAWRKDFRFRSVTIKPDLSKGTLGYLLHRKHPKWFQPDIDHTDRIVMRIQRHILISFAGQIAEAEFLGRKPRYGMEHDNQSAVDMASFVTGSVETTEAYLKYCFAASNELIKVNWQNVTAVASALLERETLTYEDVLEAMMPGTKQWVPDMRRRSR